MRLSGTRSPFKLRHWVLCKHRENSTCSECVVSKQRTVFFFGSFLSANQMYAKTNLFRMWSFFFLMFSLFLRVSEWVMLTMCNWLDRMDKEKHQQQKKGQTKKMSSNKSNTGWQKSLADYLHIMLRAKRFLVKLLHFVMRHGRLEPCTLFLVRCRWRRSLLFASVMVLMEVILDVARLNEHFFCRIHSMHSAGPWPISM